MDKVSINNLQGENGVANVVRYFNNNGSEYLIYSLNEVDEGYTRLYVTKLNGVDGIYTANTLNDNEWNEVKNLVKLIVKANKEGSKIPVQDLNPSKIQSITLNDKKIFKLNTPLVDDLAKNKPSFENNNIPTEGEKQTPGTPIYEVPKESIFNTPSTPMFGNENNYTAADSINNETTSYNPFGDMNQSSQPFTTSQFNNSLFEMPDNQNQPSFETTNNIAQPGYQDNQNTQNIANSYNQNDFNSSFTAPDMNNPFMQNESVNPFEINDNLANQAVNMTNQSENPFAMNSAISFNTPVEPTFNINDQFANNNGNLNFTNQTQSDDYKKLYEDKVNENKELENKINQLNNELAKYKNILVNVKNIIND